MTDDFATLHAGMRGRTLGLAEIVSLGERILACPEAWSADPELPSQRVAVIGAETTDLVARAVACAIVQEGRAPVVHQTPYGAYVQAVLDPGSDLHAFAPDLVVICVHWRELVQDLPIDAPQPDVDAAVDSVAGRFEALWRTLADRHNCILVQHYVEDPPSRPRGWAERTAPASPFNQAQAVGRRLAEAGEGRIHWLDLQTLAARIGTDRWFSPREHLTARLPFASQWLPDYLSAFRGVWRGACGGAKKVLAVDLDDTLWGGIIGDDGVQGLTLGPGSPSGEAFAHWQRHLKGLRDRGVVLTVCSKNDPEMARRGFAHHGAVLTLEDISAFECSWSDKASGLARIAQTLNVHVSSIVLADDNPAECELVRATLPEVETVALGSDPTAFVSRLAAGYWFELDRLTSADYGRGASYAARAPLIHAGASSPGGLAAFLADLDMVGELSPAQAGDLPRLAQLEQKTNQFNLTTRRYTSDQLRDLMQRGDAVVLAASLKDRLADHGLVSSLVVRVSDVRLEIDSWLMSCRVFSRTLEAFIMRGLVELARTRGCTEIVGRFAPTDRNAVAADTYRKLGFSSDDAGAWRRDAAAPLDDLETQVRAP